jgi:hypothetical protein
MVLAVFINVNIVDDRFVSPLEDMSHQYQSYELEETTRVLSIQGKKHEQISKLICLPFELDRPVSDGSHSFSASRDFIFSDILLNFYLLSIPPPSLA